MRHIFAIASLFFILICDANACIVKYQDSAQLKAEAAVIVIAVVSSKDVQGQSQLGELYSYNSKIIKIEKGLLGPEKTLKVTYYNLWERRDSDGKINYPIKDGSGIENDLKIGKSYRFFLKSNEKPEILYTEEA